MARCLVARLGQATTEIAVLGTIMLVIFGALIRYGQMFNAQQEAQMYAFRKSVELADKRFHAGDFGGDTVVAMKEYSPIDLFSSEPQPTYATGSSTITLDEKQTFYDRDNPNPEDFPATYYQIGNKMIKDNELVQAPYMYIERKVDKNKAPRTPIDSTIDIINWISSQIDGSKDKYDSYEAAPFWETNQTTGNDYVSREQRASYYSTGAGSSYTEASSKKLNTTMAYEVEPNHAILASDDLINHIYSVPDNMVVEQNQTIEKERSYSAWN